MTVITQALAALFAAAAVFMAVVFVYGRVASFFFISDEARAAVADPKAEAKPSYLQLLLRSWAARLSPFLPERFHEDVNKRITMAGGLQGVTPAQLVVWAFFATLFGIVVGVYIVLVTGWPPYLVLGCTVVGTVLPFVWLRDRVKRRHLEILSDLPYHLDLLTLCVEAGLDFGAGVAKMVEKGKRGALREEFTIFLGQMRVGKTRAEALQAMSERVGMEQLSSFLAALIQADRMGSGLGRTLRLQAEQMRSDRFQRAEKAAGEAPVKMLFPLVLFIFPTIWIILFAPIVFEWMYRGGP